MKPGRVLVLGAYPALHPRHGGQIRLANIAAAYRQSGFDVQLASFYPEHPFYTDPGVGEGDVALPAELLASWRGKPNGFVQDLLCGEVAVRDPRRIDALERFAGAVDIVHLEQPWLLPVVHELRRRGVVGEFRLVYGSQNVEHPMKDAMLKRHQVEGRAELTQAVLEMEHQCAADADLVVAVTEADAALMTAWTAAPVIVAGNGVEPWRSSGADRAAWSARLGKDPFALYVASAHPPNVHGFGESFGGSLAGLPPDRRVVVAGDVGEYVVRGEWFQRWAQVNTRRIVVLGILPFRELCAVRDLAHTYLLPITSGGGSNLKTAEALYSARHVVATPDALRGFESFSGLARVRVAEPGPAFARAVRESLDAPMLASEPHEDDPARVLAWSHTLAPLREAVERMR